MFLAVFCLIKYICHANDILNTKKKLKKKKMQQLARAAAEAAV